LVEGGLSAVAIWYSLRHIRLFSENSTGRFPMDVGTKYLLFVCRDRDRVSVDNCGNSEVYGASSPKLREVRRLKAAEKRNRPITGDLQGRLRAKSVDVGRHERARRPHCLECSKSAEGLSGGRLSLLWSSPLAQAGVMRATAIVQGNVVRFKLSPSLARAHRKNRDRTMTETEAVAFGEAKHRTSALRHDKARRSSSQ
jgi:hypothetical protein